MFVRRHIPVYVYRASFIMVKEWKQPKYPFTEQVYCFYSHNGNTFSSEHASTTSTARICMTLR